jgi:hypothetical protein
MDVDAYQDVDQKLDFIIARRPYFRGVSIDDLHRDGNSPEISSVGIQFTINSDAEILERKRKQLEKARARKKDQNDVYEDIVLVQIDMNGIGNLFARWKETRFPGGPDKLLDLDIKKKIFYGVMNGIFSPEELDREWTKISQEQRQ